MNNALPAVDKIEAAPEAKVDNTVQLSQDLWSSMAKDSTFAPAKTDSLPQNYALDFSADIYGGATIGRAPEKTSAPAGDHSQTAKAGPADGASDLRGDNAAKTGEQHLPPEVAAARQHLLDIAQRRGENVGAVKHNMDQLENRVNKGDTSWTEVQNTYEQVSKLLEARGILPTSQADRRRLADQILNHAANPGQIEQGFHTTCNTASVESRTYTKFPAEAARVVVDVALTGQYTAKDDSGKNVTVKINPKAADAEAQNDQRVDNQRDYASEVFQVAAVNLYWQKQNDLHHTDIRYEQDGLPSKTNFTKSGESLADYSQHPAKFLADQPMLSPAGIGQISNMISGRNESAVMIVSKQLDGPEETTSQNFYKKLFNAAPEALKPGDGVKVVSSEREFAKTLETLKEQGKLPVIIAVNSAVDPIFTDSGAGTQGGSGSDHAITITDYIPGNPAKVTYENQWGADSRTHDSRATAVNTDTLYTATLPPVDAARRMQKEGQQDTPEGQATIKRLLGDSADHLRTQWANRTTNLDFNQDRFEGDVAKAGMAAIKLNDSSVTSDVRSLTYGLPDDVVKGIQQKFEDMQPTWLERLLGTSD